MTTNNTKSPERGRGRPSKRSPEVEARILAAVAKGFTYKRSAEIGGISYDTFNEWRREFSDFAEAVKKAENELVATGLLNIRQAGKRQWTAWAWILERRFPDEFGKRVQLTGKDGGPIETRERSLNDEQLDREIARLDREIAAAKKRTPSPASIN